MKNDKIMDEMLPHGGKNRGRRRFRWRANIVVILLLILCGGGYYWFFLARPAGSGPAGPNVPQEPFQTVWSERQILLLGMGDSITAGFGCPKDMGTSIGCSIIHPTNSRKCKAQVTTAPMFFSRPMRPVRSSITATLPGTSLLTLLMLRFRPSTEMTPTR